MISRSPQIWKICIIVFLTADKNVLAAGLLLFIAFFFIKGHQIYNVKLWCIKGKTSGIQTNVSCFMQFYEKIVNFIHFVEKQIFLHCQAYKICLIIVFTINFVMFGF